MGLCIGGLKPGALEVSDGSIDSGFGKYDGWADIMDSEADEDETIEPPQKGCEGLGLFSKSVLNGLKGRAEL